MFRRRDSDAPAVLDDASAVDDGAAEDEAAQRAGFTAAKGRPTPKRSEAEKRRRQPYTAPGDRKTAATQSKGRDRTERGRRMEAMRRGEAWALPRKDQGPVKALARDVVDSRRGISEYYLYGIVVLFLLLFIPALKGTIIVDLVILAVLLVIVGEGWLVSRRVMRLARERFPGESTRGVGMYTALRGTRLRKMRVPGPRVQRGQKV
ncbi:MAG: DUF3043 domain-containing protein [Streptosporangiaceae bacterium]